MQIWIGIVIAVATLIIGLAVGSLIQKRTIEARIGRAELIAKERISEAKEEVHRLRSDCDAECKERRNEVSKLEKRIIQREEQMDRKMASLESKEEKFAKKEKELEDDLAAAFQRGWLNKELQRLLVLRKLFFAMKLMNGQNMCMGNCFRVKS